MLYVNRKTLLFPSPDQAMNFRVDVLSRPVNFYSQTFEVVIGSTGAKTYTANILGQTVTFTTTFATTGTYELMFGVAFRFTENMLNIIVFPPTYTRKTAGTTPTNSVIKSTTSAISGFSAPRSIVRVCDCTPSSVPAPTDPAGCTGGPSSTGLAEPIPGVQGPSPYGLGGGPVTDPVWLPPVSSGSGNHSTATGDSMFLEVYAPVSPQSNITAPAIQVGGVAGATVTNTTSSQITVTHSGIRSIKRTTNQPSGGKFTTIDQVKLFLDNSVQPSSFSAAAAPQNLLPDAISD